MSALLTQTLIKDVVQVEPYQHVDERGFFSESYRREWFPHAREMIQSNHVQRDQGCVVGLHLHLHQADYWYTIEGAPRVVLHDMRPDSPSTGLTIGFTMTSGHGVYIPPGVAHGFSTPHGPITLTYLVDSYYNPADELGVFYNDIDVAAEWLVDNPVVSARDLDNPTRWRTLRAAHHYDTRT